MYITALPCDLVYFMHIKLLKNKAASTVLGYEPADLTMNTPPPKRSKVGSFFSHRCLVSPNFFPKEKVDFVGDIKR